LGRLEGKERYALFRLFPADIERSNSFPVDWKGWIHLTGEAQVGRGIGRGKFVLKWEIGGNG
jgi:hypothetical protein